MFRAREDGPVVGDTFTPVGRRTGEPHLFRSLFLADWDDALFVHYAVDPAMLRPHVPFELDLYDGTAYVSLVVFTQRRLRPCAGGAAAELLAAPLASHPFLNVRTYVRCGGEQGIHFLCEWIPNRLAALLGPPLYGLPYRLGRLRYQYDRAAGVARHKVQSVGRCLEFDALIRPADDLRPVAEGSLSKFLLERYVAFTRCRGKSACFRVWHAPWPQQAVEVRVRRTDLLDAIGLKWMSGPPIGGNYSPGVKDVRLSRPLRLPSFVE